MLMSSSDSNDEFKWFEVNFFTIIKFKEIYIISFLEINIVNFKFILLFTYLLYDFLLIIFY